MIPPVQHPHQRRLRPFCLQVLRKPTRMYYFDFSSLSRMATLHDWHGGKTVLIQFIMNIIKWILDQFQQFKVRIFLLTRSMISKCYTNAPVKMELGAAMKK